MADQTERAFQKQKNVFLNGKQQLLGGKNAKKVMLWIMEYTWELSVPSSR